MDTIRPMGLLAVWLHVPPEREDEFNAWYNTEHIAQITSIPGFIRGVFNPSAAAYSPPCRARA
jgi:hypothetical protein